MLLAVALQVSLPVFDLIVFPQKLGRQFNNQDLILSQAYVQAKWWQWVICLEIEIFQKKKKKEKEKEKKILELNK